jgi:hypothetical protein
MIAFHVSYAWTNSFIKNHLNWSYHVSIKIVGKLSKDYQLQGKAMAQQCA